MNKFYSLFCFPKVHLYNSRGEFIRKSGNLTGLPRSGCYQSSVPASFTVVGALRYLLRKLTGVDLGFRMGMNSAQSRGWKLVLYKCIKCEIVWFDHLKQHKPVRLHFTSFTSAFVIMRSTIYLL